MNPVTERKKILSFGLLSDTQYADSENGANFDGSRTRRFRNSLDIVRKAVDHFKRPSSQFCVLLGDVMDMRSATPAAGRRDARECLSDVISETEKADVPWHFIVGNHDLYCLSRSEIHQTYIPQMNETADCHPAKLYYSFVHPLAPHIRFIFLDAFDISSIQPSDPAQKQKSIELILHHNPNMRYDSSSSWDRSNSNWCEGLTGINKRYIPAGGGLGDQQLAWLEDTLDCAYREDQRCIVFSHLPCDERCTLFTECLMWNSEDVVSILHKYTNTVIAFFAGHDHVGGNCIDSHGIHHIIPAAPIECDENDVSYGILHIMDDSSLDIEWVGAKPPEDFDPFPDQIRFAPSQKAAVAI